MVDLPRHVLGAYTKLVRLCEVIEWLEDATSGWLPGLGRGEGSHGREEHEEERREEGSHDREDHQQESREDAHMRKGEEPGDLKMEHRMSSQ